MAHQTFILFYFYFVTILKVNGAVLQTEAEKSLKVDSQLESNQLLPEQTPEFTTQWPNPRTLFVAELSALKAVALLSFPLLVPILFAAGAVLLLPLQLFSLSAPISAIGKRVHQQQQQELLDNNIFRTRPILRRMTTRQPLTAYSGLSQ